MGEKGNRGNGESLCDRNLSVADSSMAVEVGGCVGRSGNPSQY